MRQTLKCTCESYLLCPRPRHARNDVTQSVLSGPSLRYLAGEALIFLCQVINLRRKLSLYPKFSARQQTRVVDLCVKLCKDVLTLRDEVGVLCEQ